MLTRRQFLKLGVAGVAGLAVPWNFAPVGRAFASTQIPQVALPGGSIPRFVDPLPIFGPPPPQGLAPGQVNAPRVSQNSLTVTMSEIQQKILPASVYPSGYTNGTYVWAYKVGDTIPLYPGVTVEALRNTATTMKYVNALPPDGGQVQKYITVDQTLHWANPLDLDMMDVRRMQPYSGPPPAVVHLHGAEVGSSFDGGPDQWFTPNGIHGGGYQTDSATEPNAAVYRYPNAQEATTLWFHDHTLGATRTNVYAGMAAFYLLRDQFDTGKQDNPLKLPAGPYEREIAIQGRQFDTNGQLIFPDGQVVGLNGPPPNPQIHPFWNPEFFGDVTVVNGKSWPYLDVEPRRYRFRLLDGCNARFLELRLENRAKKTPGPAFWVIGTDGGLLDNPVMLNDPKAPAGKSPRLLMAPGERYDVIIDFAGYAGQTLTLVNSAKSPFPNGLTPSQGGFDELMQFRVTLPFDKTSGLVKNGADDSYNPATGGALRKTGSVPPIVRLANPATGTSVMTPSVKRLLTLNEVMGLGGPVEALVNNTKWNGKRDDKDDTPVPGSTEDSLGNCETELPRVGDTELWEIANLTGDTHPIHLHLVQFQLMNRQAFNVSSYSKAYNALFPGGTFGGVDMVTGAWMPMVYPAGTFIPAYGPPSPYDTPNAAGQLGGNPDITPFLQGAPRQPRPEEAGWKDTVQMNPGEVTRILVRFAPQDIPLDSVSAGDNKYPFDPTAGPGYVWHCHIVDHEDNEMMRPYHPVS